MLAAIAAFPVHPALRSRGAQASLAALVQRKVEEHCARTGITVQYSYIHCPTTFCAQTWSVQAAKKMTIKPVPYYRTMNHQVDNTKNPTTSTTSITSQKSAFGTTVPAGRNPTLCGYWGRGTPASLSPVGEVLLSPSVMLLDVQRLYGYRRLVMVVAVDCYGNLVRLRTATDSALWYSALINTDPVLVQTSCLQSPFPQLSGTPRHQ